MKYFLKNQHYKIKLMINNLLMFMTSITILNELIFI